MLGCRFGYLQVISPPLCIYRALMLLIILFALPTYVVDSVLPVQRHGVLRSWRLKQVGEGSFGCFVVAATAERVAQLRLRRCRRRHRSFLAVMARRFFEERNWVI